MKQTIRKILKVLLGVSFLPMLTACYAPYYAEYECRGTVLDPHDQPITGIEVTMPSRDLTTKTNEYGYFHFKHTNMDKDIYFNKETLVFKDVDGPAGGGDFATYVLDPSVDNEFMKTEEWSQGFITVKMEYKKSE